MNAPTRRALLADSAAIVAAGATMAPVAADAAAGNPDAELIRVCAQHCINLDAYNNSDEGTLPLGAPDGPLWTAYNQSRDFITEAEPKTLAGLLAKARAARHEAIGLHGEESWGGSMGEAWAPQIVNDLLRLARGAA